MSAEVYFGHTSQLEVCPCRSLLVPSLAQDTSFLISCMLNSILEETQLGTAFGGVAGGDSCSGKGGRGGDVPVLARSICLCINCTGRQSIRSSVE